MSIAIEPAARRITKSVEYAYPRSPTAVKFGFASTGCFAVYQQQGNQPCQSLAAFATLPEAKGHAASLPHPYGTHSL